MMGNPVGSRMELEGQCEARWLPAIKVPVCLRSGWQKPTAATATESNIEVDIEGLVILRRFFCNTC